MACGFPDFGPSKVPKKWKQNPYCFQGLRRASPPKPPSRGYQTTRHKATRKPIRQEMTGRGRRCARPRRRLAWSGPGRRPPAARLRPGRKRGRVPGQRHKRRARQSLPVCLFSSCAWSCAIRAPGASDVAYPLRRKGRLRRGWGVEYAGPEIGRLRVRVRRDDGTHVG